MVNNYFKEAIKKQVKWEKLRQKVFKRDSPICSYCGIDVLKADGFYDIDHVIPRIKGGKNELSNLVLSCRRCNRSKKHYNWTINYDRRKIVCNLILKNKDFLA